MMHEYSVMDPMIVRCGRTDGQGEGYELHWSSSQVRLDVKGGYLEAEIECRYTSMKPYISFEVDGLRAQILCPLPGKHRYDVFRGLDAGKTHHVRIIKETQPFMGDPEAEVRIHGFFTEGELMPQRKAKKKLLFFGDSITSGEGGRGPVSFNEWVPMAFSALDAYPRRTADLLQAEYEVISQSGWGVVGSWDNHPDCAIPLIWDQVRLTGRAGEPAAKSELSFVPDEIVIALGTNDENAIRQPAYCDPVTGKTWKLEDTEEGKNFFMTACAGFLTALAGAYPSARINWMVFSNSSISAAIHETVDACAAQSMNVRFLAPLDHYKNPPEHARGSRMHPGEGFHKRIAAQLSRELK